MYLSGCCSQKGYGRPPTVYQQKSISADLGGFLNEKTDSTFISLLQWSWWFKVTFIPGTVSIVNYTFLVLNLCLDIFNSVRGFHLKGDGFTRQCLYKDLHDGARESAKLKLIWCTFFIRKLSQKFHLVNTTRVLV